MRTKTEHEAIGQAITMIIPPDLHEEEYEILRRLRAGERIDHYETVRVTRAGQCLDVSLTISPLRDPAGRIIGCSKIARDITEAKQAGAALRHSEQRLTREVASAKTLQSISTRLISESTPESLYDQILGAAMELTASDAASVQMLAADHTSLKLLAWTNFHPDSAAFWQRVEVGAGSSCSKALSDNERVVVADIEACEFMAGFQDQEEYRRSGIRAVQSTPLRSRTGRPLGMLSTHWRTPHTPTEDDFRFFDVLARQAADLIERTLAEEALRDSEERFRLIANTAPVMIWMSSTANEITYLNQTWLDYAGRPSDPAVETLRAMVLHPDEAERCREVYEKAFEHREAFQLGDEEEHLAAPLAKMAIDGRCAASPVRLSWYCRVLGPYIRKSGRGDWIRTSDPCAQGKLGRPCEVLFFERFAASENSWAQIWAQSIGDAL